MTEYLTLDDAFALIDDLGFVVVDIGLLASAVARPTINLFGEDAYPDLMTKAAALLHSLAGNRALLEGNKRTAWVLTQVFLDLNGATLVFDDDDLVEFMLAVAQDLVGLGDIAKWLADRS